MGERWSLTVVKANLSSILLWIILCVYLLLYAGLKLLHLTVTQILYTCMYYIIFIQDIFTAQIFANMF